MWRQRRQCRSLLIVEISVAVVGIVNVVDAVVVCEVVRMLVVVTLSVEGSGVEVTVSGSGGV